MRLIVALLLISPAIAQPLAILQAPPGLDDAGRAGHARLVLQNHPRAFALSPDGKWGSAWGGGAGTVDDRALQSCAAKGGGACAIYLRDNAILWPGRQAAPPAAPTTLFGGITHEFLPDPRFLWRGPGAAAGVLVWSHGVAPGRADSRGGQPHPWVRHFNNAGWDVVRFDRHPNSDDVDRAAAWLKDGIAELRRRGYARVVAGGQSRGGWNSLMMLQYPGTVDGVVAIAWAKHGDGSIGNPHYGRATDEFRAMAATAQTRVPVVGASFEGDNFVPDGALRSAVVTEVLMPRVGRLLWLDRPAPFSGHGAGGSWQFGEKFGACILRFVTTPNPPTAC